MAQFDYFSPDPDNKARSHASIVAQIIHGLTSLPEQSFRTSANQSGNIRKICRSVLTAVPHPYRTALILFFMEEMTFQEIAEQHHGRPNDVKDCVDIGLKLMQHLLWKLGYSYSIDEIALVLSGRPHTAEVHPVKKTWKQYVKSAMTFPLTLRPVTILAILFAGLGTALVVILVYTFG